MKSIRFFICLTLALMTTTLISQNRIFSIHEDPVKPAHIQDYEKVAKNLAATCKEHNFAGPGWMAAKTDDHRYLYVTEIESMADLDKNQFEDLISKMGADAFGEMMSKFSGYDEHATYTIQLREDLSYQPDGIDPRTEGQDFRRFNIWHIEAGKVSEALAVFKEMKALSAKMGSKLYYRVYQNHFGQMGPYFQIAASGESNEEYVNRRAESFAKMGDEGAALMARLNAVTWKLELFNGEILPEMSYMPK